MGPKEKPAPVKGRTVSGLRLPTVCQTPKGLTGEGYRHVGRAVAHASRLMLSRRKLAGPFQARLP